MFQTLTKGRQQSRRSHWPFSRIRHVAGGRVKDSKQNKTVHCCVVEREGQVKVKGQRPTQKMLLHVRFLVLCGRLRNAAQVTTVIL